MYVLIISFFYMIDKVVEGKRDEVPEKDLEIIDRLHRISEHKRQVASKRRIFE